MPGSYHFFAAESYYLISRTSTNELCPYFQDDYQHPRDVFLFNDLLLVTKQMTATPSKTSCASAASSPDGIGGGPFYSFRDALSLSGMEVTLFHTPGERKLLLFICVFYGKFHVSHSLLPRRPTDPKEGRPSVADSERQVRTRPLQVRHGFASKEVLMFNRYFNDLVMRFFFPGEHLRGGADGARNVRDPGGALFANANKRRVKQNKITN